MKQVNNGGPAFPMPSMMIKQGMELLEQCGLPDAKKEQLAEQLGENACGMTLRDYFAAKAMQGFLSRPGSVDPKQDAALAYIMADAMLKAREAA